MMESHPEFTKLWENPEDAVQYGDKLRYVQFPQNIARIHQKLATEKYQYLGDVVTDLLLIINNSARVN